MNEDLLQTMYLPCDFQQDDIEIHNEWMDGQICWARVISGRREELLTAYTRHTFYEIQYALEGRIDLLLSGGQQITLNESELIVIPPDTYHQIVDSAGTGARFILAFSLTGRGRQMQEFIRRLSVPAPCPDNAHLRSLLSILLDKAGNGNPIRRCLLSTLLESVLLEVIELLSPVGPHPGGQSDVRVNEIAAYIRSCGGVNVRVSDIARHFGLSERHLNRLFTAVCGQNLRAFIQHEKLKRIEELMVSTNLPLGEIAGLCGFSDTYAMTRFFRRCTLTSPTQFRHLVNRPGKNHR